MNWAKARILLLAILLMSISARVQAADSCLAPSYASPPVLDTTPTLANASVLLASASSLYAVQADYDAELGPCWVETFDLSDPVAPVAVGSDYLGPSIKEALLEGDYIYAWSWQSLFQVSAIGANGRPSIAGSVPTLRSYMRMVVGDGIIYGLWPNCGSIACFARFDSYTLSEPASPEFLQSFSGYMDFKGGIPPGVLFTDGQLVLANRTSDSMWAISVDDTGGPIEGGPEYLLGTNGGELKRVGDYLYCVSAASGLSVVDMSEVPVVLAGATVPLAGEPRRIAVDGAVLYVVIDGLGLQSIDISNPTAPQPIGFWGGLGNVKDLYVRDGVGWVLADGQLITIDLTSAAPTGGVGLVGLPGPAAFGASTTGRAVVASDPALLPGLYVNVLDLSTPDMPVAGPPLELDQDRFQGLAVDWDRGIAAISAVRWVDPDLLLLADVNTSGAPQILYSSDDTDPIRHLLWLGSHLVGWKWDASEMWVYDTADPAAPELVATMPLAAEVREIVADGTSVIVASDQGVLSFDFSNPLSPQPGQEIDRDRAYESLAVDDQRLVALDRFGDAWSWWRGTSQAWQAGGSLRLPTGTHGVEVFGSRAYVMGGYLGVHVLELHDADAISLIETADSYWRTHGISRSSDGLVFFEHAGVRLPSMSCSPTAVGEPPSYLVDSLVRLTATPNPFNPSVELVIETEVAGMVSVDVYDTAGRRVRAFGPMFVDQSDLSLRWDGRDGTGARVSSGVYFVRARMGDELSTVRITQLK